MAITSQTSKIDGIGECMIEDWHRAGLLKPSAIKPAISTIEQSLVLKILGQFCPDDIISMEKALRQLLELK